ncbi:unnamed protein product [Sphenostylis stenocarpa]|uniref:Yos1-like protein n=1 Tax=Sphenostylis stenocarpa TaxID=92480 RepID=A0AA86SL13_9FABA|nr:unnamed protein product [Sphenostylis stenocarpa]
MIAIEFLHSVLSFFNSTHRHKLKSATTVSIPVINHFGNFNGSGLFEKNGQFLAINVVRQFPEVPRNPHLLRLHHEFSGSPSCAYEIWLFFFWLMKMGFWTFLEGILLFANALAILNEERFLAPRGWTLADMTGPRRNSLKGQVIGLIYACQFLRLPLILFNSIFIIVKLISG